MQTFMPFRDFQEVGRVLDLKRLRKQLVEVQQIYNAAIHDRGWVNHPATKMWAPYTPYLLVYGDMLYEQYFLRTGRIHESGEFIRRELNNLDAKVVVPIWLRDKYLIIDYFYTHQRNLLRKDYNLYAAAFPNELPDDVYLWFDMDKRQWYYQKVADKKRQRFYTHG